MLNIHLIQNQVPFVFSSLGTKHPLNEKEIHDVKRSTARVYRTSAQTAKNRKRNRRR